MRKQSFNFRKMMISLFALMLMFSSAGCGIVNAEGRVSFSLSPMNEVTVLNPGESYRSSFRVNNPADNEEDLNYEIAVQPYYVDDENRDTFAESSDRNMIVDWITIEDGNSGKLSPNSFQEIYFDINVPNDAPTGGQYAAITVTAKNDPGASQESVGINENIAIAYLVYTEIAGDTIRQGEVQSVDVPSLLLSGNISGTSTIKNVGNVHGVAKYTLQVFPLFSDEEVYTNEEDPETMIILPDRSYYSETAWNETPDVGIFNVVYTVEFEGVTTQVSKMVIKCPVWLLFIIFFVIAAIVIWIAMRVRGRKKAGSRRNSGGAAKGE